MNLRNLPDEKLLSLTSALVSEERETTASILHYLAEIDRRELYSKCACSSLFEYCVKVLGYSESAAQKRIVSARLLEKLPDLAKKIESGALTLTVVSHAHRFFRRENTPPNKMMEILRKLERQTGRNAERILASLSTVKEPPKEKIRPLDENLFELRIPLTETLYQDLHRLKDLWKLNTVTEVLEKMAAACLAKADPLRKAQRSVSIPGSVKNTQSIKSNSRHIPAHIRHQVWLRDEGKCTYSDGTHTCGSTYAVEIDHIIPFAKGGQHTLENLRLRCRTHNQLHAREEFPELVGSLL